MQMGNNDESIILTPDDYIQIYVRNKSNKGINQINDINWRLYNA
ncbi:MAG: hypothetical protein ACK5JH_14605 [Anaerocolumna sp.]